MIRGEVYWRQSGANISSPTPENFGKKLLAFSQFLQWSKARFPDETLQRKFRALLRDMVP